jgi:hypothetical protein
LLIAKVQEIDDGSPKIIKKKHFIGEDKVYKQYIKLIREVHEDLWG